MTSGGGEGVITGGEGVAGGGRVTAGGGDTGIGGGEEIGGKTGFRGGLGRAGEVSKGLLGDLELEKGHWPQLSNR